MLKIIYKNKTNPNNYLYKKIDLFKIYIKLLIVIILYNMNFNVGDNEGRLDIVIGTMFSGKTSYILGEITKMAELNYKTLYINIEFDNRSEQIFSTHNPFFENHTDFIKKENIQKNVKMIKSKTLMDLEIDSYDVIIVDEAHFFDELIEFANKCLDKKKNIVVAGLQADFRGIKFGKILDLIPICTDIKRLHAYCSECAKSKKCRIAIYSKRVIKSKKITEIGGSDKYIPVCREHFQEAESEIQLPIPPKVEKSKEKKKSNGEAKSDEGEKNEVKKNIIVESS
jgi:thymidine kinase